MKAAVISVLTALGAAVAATASAGCIIAFIDEPSMPKAMIERWFYNKKKSGNPDFYFFIYKLDTK